MILRASLLSLALAGPALSEQAPLPFNLGGAFELTDQHGQTRSEAEPDGKHQLLFFGYANCREICSAVFPLMADMIDATRAKGVEISPVMITVDPARDTADAMGPILQDHHRDFIGLTGDAGALQVAYDAYQVETEEVFTDPEYGPVYAHGSFIYLLDGAGNFLTLIPPILGPEQAADIVLKYAKTPS